MSNVNCLVAGGAGFIGSHLCEKLLEHGYEVTCVDNLLTGRKENIDHLLSNKQFQFFNADVTNSPLSIINSEPAIDYIYHLASPASPNKNNPKSYINFPVETLLVNSLGTYNLLELAKKTGAKFLYASSSEIYGDPLKHPQKEDYWGNVSSAGVRSCYDEGKRFGEAITMAYFRKFDVDVRIIRIFNTYGPRMSDDGRAVISFIFQALNEKPLTIYGDGQQTRSFCYVDDLVGGLIKALEEPKTNGEVFNLGNPQEYTILDLAKTIRDLINSKSELVFEEMPEDDPRRRCPDIEKAREVLGWQPKISLSEGLQKTIEYIKKAQF